MQADDIAWESPAPPAPKPSNSVLYVRDKVVRWPSDGALRTHDSAQRTRGIP